MRYKFTDKEIDKIQKSIVILVDTREQNNKHIIDFFNLKGIKYQSKKLDFGDYSFMIPKGSFEGQERDIYFDRDIVLERKNSIDEIAGNFKDDAVRLRTELAHLNKYNIKYFILLEDAFFDDHIRDKNSYRTLYDPNALYNRILALETEYDTVIRPTAPKYMGSYIYNKCRHFIRNKLKRVGFIEEDVATMLAKDILEESESDINEL